jgi:hypothetical protein
MVGAMKRTLSFTLFLALSSVGCEKKEETVPTVEPGAGSAPSATPTPAPAVEPTSPTGAFEGEVDLLTEAKGPKPVTFKSTMLLKAGKMRMDVAAPGPQGGFSQIVDPDSEKVISLAHGPKVAMEMSRSGFFSTLAPWMPKDAQGEAAQPDMKKTDRTAIIVGHPCQYWDYTLKGRERGSICLADIGVDWVHLGGPEATRWASQTFGSRRFPVRYVSYDSEGKETSTMEVTRLERKRIPDSVFEVPADYKRMNAPNMMEGLPAMMGGAEGARPDGMKLPRDVQERLEKFQREQAR